MPVNVSEDQQPSAPVKRGRLGRWGSNLIFALLALAFALAVAWSVFAPWLAPRLVGLLGAPPATTAPTSPPVNAQGTLSGAAQTAADRGIVTPPEQPKAQDQATPVPLETHPTGAPVVAPQPAGEKSAEDGARSRSAERSEVGQWYKAGPVVAVPTARGKQMTLDRDGAAVGVGKGARP